MWRARAGEPRAFGAPILAAAFLAGQVLLVGVPPSPGPERTLSAEQGLFWFVLVAGIVLALETPARKSLAALLALRGAAAAVLIDIVAGSKLAHAWKGLEAVLQFGALLATLFVVWLATAELVRRRRGFGPPAALCVAAALLAPAALWSGSALLGQLGGALAAALGATAVAALLRPSLSLVGGAASLAVLAGFGLGTCSRLYAGLPLGPALLLASAPLGAWLGELAALRERPFLREAARLAAVAALGGAALAWILATREVDPYGY